MSLDSTMDKVLARRTEVENILNDAASLSVDEMANFARELSELRPVCEQIELGQTEPLIFEKIPPIIITVYKP